VIRLLLFGLVLILVHLLTLAGAIPLAAMIVVGALILVWATAMLRGVARRPINAAIVAVVCLAAVGVFAAVPTLDMQTVLIAPPLLGYLLTSAVFAYSLLPDKEPLITRFCRLMRRGALPDGLEEYARMLTWAWAILPAFLAVTAMGIYAAFGLNAWSWASNVVNPALLVTFYVGEHVFRGLCLPHLGTPSILETVEVMFDPVSWR
jgi:uncharacterized membrane protein